MADKRKPGGAGTRPGNGGPDAGGETRDQHEYSTDTHGTQAHEIERLRTAADWERVAGNHATYCAARRAFLLAQAAAYMAGGAA